MDGQEPELPATDRAVRAPGDAVESAVSHLSDEPRRRRVLSDVVVAGAAAAAVALARRLRRR